VIQYLLLALIGAVLAWVAWEIRLLRKSLRPDSTTKLRQHIDATQALLSEEEAETLEEFVLTEGALFTQLEDIENSIANPENVDPAKRHGKLAQLYAKYGKRLKEWILENKGKLAGALFKKLNEILKATVFGGKKSGPNTP
jgi:hypothetical protein